MQSDVYTRACRSIPGGVNSPVRAFGAVGGNPVFIDRAQGPYVWDIEGRRYIDYVGSWGPCILGHANDAVVRAVKAAAERGTSFGAATVAEIELAERIKQRVDSVEMVRLVNSGTEATMSALRLARAFTGRDKVIKFAGCYHGHADSFLVQAGSGAAQLPVPISAGVTIGAAGDTLVARFNDIDSVTELLQQYDGQVAAVIVEPIVGNAGLIPPAEGFLTALRNAAHKVGALFILDEVMTGFRVAAGGAGELYDIKADIVTMGKVIGGGLPVGAFGGRCEIMELLAPLGPVYQAGTLSGNPLAVAAGLATLSQLDGQAYELLENRAAQLEAGVRDNLYRLGLPFQYQRVGSMACLFFTSKDEPVRNYDDAIQCNTECFARYFQGMLQRGVYLPPSQYETFFISTTHSEQDIDNTIKANYQVLREICTKK